MLEADMLNVGYEYLLGKDEYKIVKREVPFLSRCIDVVLVNQDNILISIEFKVSKWRHAIEQANNHKLGSDAAYICLPKRTITEKLRRAVTDAGIGLLLYDVNANEKLSVVIPAPKQNDNVPAFRDILMSTLSKI